ncbi:MAG TPA: glutamate--tRNA ligase [Candidatus Binatus sp.]|nr:glutamate--tRNA ligase [Candidatus Binatus sp.]
MNDDGTIRVRFAPAPTGSLHVGGARTALFNYLFARKAGGVLVLRSEDTDIGRSSLDSELAIQQDLRWLGLSWDEGTDVGGDYGPYRQTDRVDRYGLAAAVLLETEQAYPCYCTPEELEAERKAAEAAGHAPRYSGKCRNLTKQQRAALEAQGLKAAIRFMMPQRDVYVEDLVRGAVHFPAGSIGDFVVMKSDGNPAYNFAAVVDDSEMEISHVIRADEHLPNTPRQVALYEALERPLPLFAHVSMILAPDHQKLSKRHGATSVAEYREQGYLPAALLNYLALLGWSPGDDREFFTLDELVEQFSLERVTKSPAVFDHAKLRWFNAHYVRALSRDERADLFARWAMQDPVVAAAPDVSDPLWRGLLADAMTDHVETLNQVPALAADVLRDDVSLEPTMRGELADSVAREIVEELAAVAARSPNRAAFAQAASKEALGQLGVRHSVKGRALYHPIRIAVTGQERGIELPVLLPLLGPERVVKRIRTALS